MLSRPVKKSLKIKKKLLRLSLFAVLSLLIFCIIFITKKPEQLAIDKPIIVLNEKKPEIIGLPKRLKIPIINVDANIIEVGLTPDGAMDTPKELDEVAWYKLGPNPGEKGNAVIAGHYGFFNGKGSIFNDLHTLNKGDKLQIIDEKGLEILFTVKESRRYDPSDDATDIFISKDDKVHLNIITCDGTWKNDEKTYSNRLVIFTDKEENIN